MCDKHPYTSKKAARTAVAAMGRTIRVYPCVEDHAGMWHVTKRVDGNPANTARTFGNRRDRARRRGKMND